MEKPGDRQWPDRDHSDLLWVLRFTGRAALAWMFPAWRSLHSPGRFIFALLCGLSSSICFYWETLFGRLFVSGLPKRNKVHRVGRSLGPSPVSAGKDQALAPHQAKGRAVCELVFQEKRQPQLCWAFLQSCTVRPPSARLELFPLAVKPSITEC